MTTITLRSVKAAPLSNTEIDNNFSNLNDFKVEKTSSTGSAVLPVGTTAQRDSSAPDGLIRYNSTLGQLELSKSSSWESLVQHGQLDAAIIANSEVIANTAKVTNVSTNLSTSTDTTLVIINSSDGDNATIPTASTTNAGIMTKAMFDEHVLNNAKVTNAPDATKLPLAGGNLTGNLGISAQLKLFPPGATPYNLPNTTVAAYSHAYNGVSSQSWLGTNVTNFKFVTSTSGDHVNIELGHAWNSNAGSFFLGKSSNGSNNRFSVGTTVGELFTVLDTGEVGIGTITPVSELQVIGTITGTDFAGDGSALTGITHNVTTNLTASASATQVTVTSSDGTNAVIAAATTTYAGVMTKTDKIKLDGIAASANNYVLPSSVIHQTELSSSVSSTSTTIAANLAGVKAAYDRAWPNTTYSVGDGGLTQKNFTTTLKNKLDGIAASANNYVFPETISEVQSTNTLVKRNSSGYVHAYFFNSSGTFNTAPHSGAMGIFTGTSGLDNYGRSYSAASARTLLNVANGANNYSLPASVIHQTELSSSVSSTSTTIAANLAGVKAAYDRAWPNTTYSVGDGGLTQKNFTTTLKNKLDGIESGATADQTGSQILALFSNSITAGHIAAGAIGASELGNDVVDSQHYVANSIDEEHMANDAIGAAELKSVVSLIIYNSSGTAIKTLHGAGS